MNAAERRIAPRAKLVEIAYIGMGPENGGLVLDVSDGGLSFHAVAPVQLSEKIKFLLSLRGHSRIEGAGEVVWTNQMGTVCGMKFTSLSVGALEYLNNWTNQSLEARTASPENPAPPAAADLEEEAQPAPKADVAAISTDLQETVLSAAPEFAMAPAVAEPRSKSFALLQWRDRLLWAAFGILAAAIPITAFLFGVQVGKTEYKSAASPALEQGSQASPSTIPSSPALNLQDATGAQAAPEKAPVPAAPEAPVTGHAVAIASNTPDIPGKTTQIPRNIRGRHAGQNSDDGSADLAAAMAQLNGDNGNRDTSTAVRLLQAAVASGNSAAAVILADLYIYGDGVEKSCEQGRGLLTSASKNGNAQAKVKLDELNSEGCP